MFEKAENILCWIVAAMLFVMIIYVVLVSSAWKLGEKVDEKISDLKGDCSDDNCP